MPKREENNLGDMISSVVEDVLSSGDFARLNKGIRETIDAVFDELEIDRSGKGRTSYGAGDWATGTRDGKYSYGDSSRRWAGRGTETSQGTPRAPYEKKSWQTVVKEALDVGESLYTKNPAGQISGPIYSLLGGAILGFFGLVGVVGAGMSLFPPDPTGLVVAAVLLGIAGGGGLLMKKGRDARNRIKRFRTYVLTLGDRKFCTVKELAAAVNRDEEFVREDLRKMIELKFFPKGRLDMQGTTLMLDDESYRQYLDANQAFLERQKAAEAAVPKREQSIFSSGKEDTELQKAIAEGNRYIRKIREANAAIPGEEISRKLYRLEELMQKIFLVLEQKPDQLPKLRKFMNYYMPTTDKLVQTYRELDAQPVEGENIQKAKKDIEETLDTINDAYEKLLDNFFEEAAMDVSTDISVLQNLMAQEGLTTQPFGKIQ